MRIIIVLLLFLMPVFTIAQSADFIILKKKGKTVKMFYKGSNIEFITTLGAYKNAVINDIKNDSIFSARIFDIKKANHTWFLYSRHFGQL